VLVLVLVLTLTPMKTQRLQALDALRGFAMLWMTVFHFSFDLSQAGYTQQNFYADPVWTWQRTAILSLFLLCAGAGQAVATHRGQTWAQFGRRWLQIAGCAVLVTLGSALMFPQSYIYFGVLHGMVVMLLVVRLTAGWGRWLWLLGLLTVAMKFVAGYAIPAGVLGTFLNEKMFNWLGLISVKPITEDYVPVVPWLGVMWWGMAAGQWWLRADRSAAHGITERRFTVQQGLATLGRWSLSYYMLHQPVLLAGLWLWAKLA
jgi:uncharacterized membrane protein